MCLRSVYRTARSSESAETTAGRLKPPQRTARTHASRTSNGRQARPRAKSVLAIAVGRFCLDLAFHVRRRKEALILRVSKTFRRHHPLRLSAPPSPSRRSLGAKEERRRLQVQVGAVRCSGGAPVSTGRTVQTHVPSVLPAFSVSPTFNRPPKGPSRESVGFVGRLHYAGRMS